MDVNATGRATRSEWIVPAVVAAVAFVIAAIQASAAASSADNCGELPGIARVGAMVIGGGLALGIVIGGGVLGAITKRWLAFGSACLIGFAIVAGIVLAFAVAPRAACEGSLPREIHQILSATLT